jgi:hypothetical protein
MAAGASKLQAVPHSALLLPAHDIVGGVVSMVVTVWLQALLLPQASRARQVRVALKLHGPFWLVTVLRIWMPGLAGSHPSVAEGASKLQTALQLTVLLAAQTSTGGVVSTTVTA